ncbi:hypothetical protein JZ751_023508 [Albula glossodonta]|uniref:Ig-like domain-containing protein n=1 Tax=Albula glossodonta TaxID=121402 RepID=A0A8T2NTE8_9TELE|nr:hypothetical protein JZ751_023508 [Albula glossodonta]
MSLAKLLRVDCCDVRTSSGPTNVRTEVTPVAALPNGTLFVQKDSAVSFNCSSNSYPSQTLSWVFQDLESNSSVLASSNKSPLELHVSSIQSSNQGTYSCIAQNTLSNQTASKSTLLLMLLTDTLSAPG